MSLSHGTRQRKYSFLYYEFHDKTNSFSPHIGLDIGARLMFITSKSKCKVALALITS